MLEAFAVLLRPLFAAWDQEFGGRVRTAAPPDAPPETPADVPVSEPVILIGLPRPEAGVAPVSQSGPPVSPGVAPAEPLYVRRGAGRGARYDVAPPDASGQRFRLLVVGKRKKFTPVEARR